MATESPYWQNKSLEDMTAEEWESLCDGCGHCCLHKLQDEDTGIIYVTRIACELLDLQSCQCQDYANRLSRVPMCAGIRADNINELHWLPNSCAYRCLNEGRELPTWHPLISRNKQSVIEAGMSVCLFAQSEKNVHPEQWQDCIISICGEDK